MKPLFPLTLMIILIAAAPAQEPVRLSLQQAIALAVSPNGAAAVQIADAAAAAARARVERSHAYRLPLLTASVSESNVTRNLGAEGFNFPTGVPNFKIPSEVGPFNVFDGRVEMTQTVFDLSAMRRSRAISAEFGAVSADATTNREAAAAHAAHDYLAALEADAIAEGAKEGVAQAEAMARTAQERIDAGKASDAEMTRARMHLAANRRKLSAAENDAAQARLQLEDDLGLDFDKEIVLTDKLRFQPAGEGDIGAALELALGSRAELKTAAGRAEQARDEAGAVHAGMLPTVAVFGDVGPQNSVITHTVGISARITVFDGGRRRAEEQESAAEARQYEIEQRDLRRRIELEVRRAFAHLKNAASEARECDSELGLAEEDLARARRRYQNGVADNAELVDAEARASQARQDRVQAYFAWNQARLEMAQATGTAESLDMK
jgi:outer membrane protein TolC